MTLDREALYAALASEAGDPEFSATYIKTRPHLFSNVPVFLPASAIAGMREVMTAIEATSRLSGYRDAALSFAPAIALQDHGPIGAFMGYDFHLDDDGPRLIEVNTNAGGAFLNAVLARAQRACCPEIEENPTPRWSKISKPTSSACSRPSGSASAVTAPRSESRSSMIGRRSNISIPSSSSPGDFS